MNSDFKRAKRIRTTLQYDGVESISVGYVIDDEIRGTLNIRFPSSKVLSKLELSSIALIASFILAKLCLAETVDLGFDCSTEILEPAIPILRLLYDVRCYRDKRDLLPLPRILLSRECLHLDRPSNPHPTEEKRAHLVWSGGKDSTLALLLLRANNYAVTTFHATANDSTIDVERDAVLKLKEMLDVSVSFIEMNPGAFTEIGLRYSPSFGKFPVYNSIPHGRDFLLLTLLATEAFRYVSPIICTGSEYEVYSKVIPYQGAMIYRHDAQSEIGYRLLSKCLSTWYGANILAFSPVAPLTEYRSFKVLLERMPKVFSHLSSCFWSNWCGECFKCFRYSLLQRVLGVNLISFKSDPLLKSPFAKRYLENWRDRSLPYWQEIEYCMSVLAQSDAVVQATPILEEFRTKVLPESVHMLNEIYHEYLMKTHETDHMPVGFDATLMG